VSSEPPGTRGNSRDGAGSRRYPPTGAPAGPHTTGDQNSHSDSLNAAAHGPAANAATWGGQPPTGGPDQPSTIPTPPCRYPSRRPRDWRTFEGRWICGICHPPVNRVRIVRAPADAASLQTVDEALAEMAANPQAKDEA
jgi:hypothetical protein